MSLLDFFKQAKLQSTWNYETSGVLWQLLPTTTHLFVGEDRNLETKRVTFFCLDAGSGKVLWKNLSFTEQWWIGIEAVTNNVLYLHEFATPDMPDHKKIYAVRVDTGQMLWVNEELQFHFADAQFVFGSKLGFESRQYFRIEISSGKIMDEISADLFQRHQDSAAERISPDFIFPNEVNDIGALKKEFKKIPLSVLTVQSQMECIKQNGNLILTFYQRNREYEKDGTFLEQHILIVDQNGRILYRDVINEQVKIPLPDTVLYLNGLVYYIKNRKSLIAVKLFE